MYKKLLLCIVLLMSMQSNNAVAMDQFDKIISLSTKVVVCVLALTCLIYYYAHDGNEGITQ